MATSRKKKTGRTAEKDYLQNLNAVVDVIFGVAYTEKEWTWTQLAAAAGLSYATVCNLGNRLTRFPEYRSLYRLAKAVGLELTTVSRGGKKQLRLKRAA